MFVEIQLAAETLGRILRRQVDPRFLSAGVEFAADGIDWVVDRIVLTDGAMVDRATTLTATEIWGDGTYFSIDVPRMQVIQPLEVHLVDRRTMLANGPDPSSPTRILTIRLVFDVQLVPQTLAAGVPAPVAMAIGFSRIDWLLLGADETLESLRTTVEEQAKARLKIPDTLIDLGSMWSHLHAAGGSSPSGAVNAGIQCDPARNVAALRFQLASRPKSTTGWQWESFFSTGPVDVTSGDDWAMVLDFRILEREIAGPMQSHLSAPGHEVRLSGDPSFSWHANAGLHVYVAGEAIDACPMLVENMDVDFDAKIDLTFGMTGGVLTMSGDIDVGPTDPLEVIGCVATNVLLFPFMGAKLWADGKISWWHYAIGVAGFPIAPIIGSIVMLGDLGPSGKAAFPLGGGGQCTRDGDKINCELPLSGTFGGTSLKFTHMSSADPRGPVVTGSVVERPIDMSVLNVTANPFAWKVDGSCDLGFAIDRFADLTVSMSSGTGVITSVTLVEDPKGRYTLTAAGPRFLVAGGLKSPFSKKAVSYPARVKIVTSAGCRIVDLGIPDELTPGQRAVLEDQIKLNERGCRKAKEAADGYIVLSPDTPPLPGDPPRPVLDIDLWRIGVADVEPGSVIDLIDDAGHLLRSISAGASGTVSSVITGDARRPLTHVSVQLNGQPMTRSGGRLMARQLKYQHLAWVDFPVGALVRLTGEPSGLKLVVRVADQTQDIDLSVPRAARRLPAAPADERAQFLPSGITRHDPTLLARGDILIRLEPDLGRAQVLQLHRATTVGSATPVRL